MDHLTWQLGAILAALISTSALMGACLYEESVLDLVWTRKPLIVRPIEGGANHKLFWVPADLIASTSLLVATWAAWPAAATRYAVLVGFGLYVISMAVSVAYFVPELLRAMLQDCVTSRTIVLVALIVALAIAGCKRATVAVPRANPNACGDPIGGIDSWQVATPESVGLSKAALCAMVKSLAESTLDNVHAVVVVRHGKLVFEQYFTGDDEHLGSKAGIVTFGPTVRHDERSVSKSVVSLVMGIAIDHGWIKTIDAPIFSFFPEYADLGTPDKSRITIRDLLTMSSGLEWHEEDVPYTSPDNSEIVMDRSSDPLRAALAPDLAAQPGKVWNYNSGSTELLAAILKKATGKAVDQLAATLLFAPLGITDFTWYKHPNGSPHAAGGLRLRPRDLAKIGQLILQRGSWNGTQVVSPAWIDAATAPHIMGEFLFFYGYQFWLGRSLVNGHEVKWTAAVGLGGQRLYVIPELDMVVALNSGMYTSAQQGRVALQVLDRYMMPAVEHSG